MQIEDRPKRAARQPSLDTSPDNHRARAIIATVLNEAGQHWTPKLRQAIARPELFQDGQLRIMAKAINTASANGIIPSSIAIHEHLPKVHRGLVWSFQPTEALPLAIIEIEAETFLENALPVGIETLLGESWQAIKDNPKSASSIARHTVAALERITAEGDGKSSLTLRSPDELLAMTFDDSDRIIGDRLLATGQSLAICGAGGVGKSRLLLLLLACIAGARRFLTFDTFKPEMKWLVLQTENSNRRLQQDLAPIKSWLGDDWLRFTECVTIHTIETDSDAFVNLDDPDAVARIEAAIQNHKPDGIAIDPLADFAAGDLNKDADMKLTLQSLSRLCRRGNPKRSIIVLHHAITGRGGAAKATGYDRASFARNSKMLHAWARGQINLAPVDPDSNDRLIVACGKCSNGREFQTFAVRLNPDTMIYECDPTVDVSQWERDITGTKDNAPLMNPDRVRELCAVTGSSKAALAKSIMDDCGCYRGSAYRYITRAEQSKIITFNKSHETYFRK
ncbi:MAG: AAA family ATPase [Verrucomicrobiota bacterium]|jgi:hypothetical protein